MFEVSFTEVALLIWALIATVKWFAYKEDFKKAADILRVFIENPQAREQLLSNYEAFKKSLVNN